MLDGTGHESILFMVYLLSRQEPHYFFHPLNLTLKELATVLGYLSPMTFFHHLGDFIDPI